MKKLLLSFGALGIAIATLPLVAAFEAHVINVTARIENALSVTTDAIDFGTVFPQEELDAPIEVALSQSFLDEDRVDDVQYFIRQKPKCAYTWNDGENADLENTATGHVVLNDVDVTSELRIDCGEAPRPPREDADLEQPGIQTETWGVLPSLCPYLSKHKGADGVEANETELDAFHEPWWRAGHQVAWADTFGYLTKAGQDIIDHWTIDLKVPCFGNHCAQDWDDFVGGINPNATSTDFIQPIENEHKVFGCDLWIEVSGVSTSTTPTLPVCGNSLVEAGEQCDDGNTTNNDGCSAQCTLEETPSTGTLFIEKVVINDEGGDTPTSTFAFQVDGGAAVSFEADGQNGITVAAGFHSVTEVAVAGYTISYQNCTNVNVPSGGSATCIITNNDQEIPAGPSTLLADGFGTTNDADIQGWDEDVSVGTFVRVAGIGANTVSPDGGAFALLNGGDGWMCRSINATLYHTLMLSYYWRGDLTATAADQGIVEYKIGGACADTTGWTTLQSHDMDSAATWTTQSPFALSALDGQTFFLRFRANSATNARDFRVDGVLLTGLPI